VPELPEVESVRAGLARHVTGRTFSDVQVFHPRAVRRHLAGPEDFAAALADRQIGDVRRRGKYLWLTVGEDALLAHLGMSGQLLIEEPAAPFGPHLRTRFQFSDGGQDLRFVDQRTFGHLLFSPGGAQLPGVIAHIAPDPLEAAFDDELFAARLKKRQTGIKRALLDQSLISGVGNIYADESLWRAGLHWARGTDTLRRSDVVRLMEQVRAVFAEAIGAGGTSFDSLYVQVDGRSGYFDRSLAVYGRDGLPCPRCGTPVIREKFMNRSSFSCPKCQRPASPGGRPPGAPRGARERGRPPGAPRGARERGRPPGAPRTGRS
jgi:formamidopyrimidine-DNA glycosylase